MNKLILSLLLMGLGPAIAQKNKKPANAPVAPVVKADTAKKKSGPQPYRQLVAKAKKQNGLFTIHKISEDYYFEIPDSIVGKEFIAITRISKSPAGAGYGGEEENRQTLRWEKGPNNKMFLRGVLYISASPDSTSPIQMAVRNSNVDPILAAFDIKSIRKDTSVVINVTDFFKGDNQIVSLDPVE